MTKPSRPRQTGKVTFAQAARDVLIASLSKGQFIPALLAGLFGMMVWKMPNEDVSKLVFEILEKLENGSLVGYVLAVAGFSGWFVHSKWQRRIIRDEIERLADERNKLQERSLGKPNIKSSE